MKTWEQAEFESQQEAIKKWAEKKYLKIYYGRFFWKRLGKLNRLIKIITGNPNACVDIKIYKEGADGDESEIRNQFRT